MQTHDDRQAALAVRQLAPDEAVRFADLTFPAYRHLILDPPDRELVWLGAAADDGQPVALTGGMGGPDGEFEMISIHVLPFWRGGGLGRRLNDALFAAFAARGYRHGACWPCCRARDGGGQVSREVGQPPTSIRHRHLLLRRTNGSSMVSVWLT